MITRVPWLPALCLLALWVTGRRLDAQSGAPPAAAPPTSAAQITPLGQTPDWPKLSAFAKTLTQDEFTAILRDIYLEPTHYPLPWTLGLDGLKITTGSPETPVVTIPFSTRTEPKAKPLRFWRRASELPPVASRPPLSDLHVAIDPGHIGGNFGVMEERHLSFKPREAIQEGDLSLLTARVLEERLRALGAYVTLVRQHPQPVTTKTPGDFRPLAAETLRQSGFTAPADSYAGIQGEARLLTLQWQSEKFFYRIAEIHARALRVNEEIKPDIVLCLHFNAESWGDATAPQYSPVNHLHLLVNGCYSPAELASQDTRFEMFHRLFSRTWEEEVPLAKTLAETLATSTGLPPYTYTTPNAQPIAGSPFVFARNLLANRLYQCPVIFFEPYVMNHQQTYRRLLLGHWVGRTLIDGTLQSSAIEDYVQGIVKGLLKHYQTHRPA
jgi:hypothetical protein